MTLQPNKYFKDCNFAASSDDRRNKHYCVIAFGSDIRKKAVCPKWPTHNVKLRGEVLVRSLDNIESQTKSARQNSIIFRPVSLTALNTIMFQMTDYIKGIS